MRMKNDDGDDCPGEWDYEDECTWWKPILKWRIEDKVRKALNGQLDRVDYAGNPRPVHGDFFQRPLTPHGHFYFAGHFRGKESTCLEDYDLRNPPMATPPRKVHSKMEEFYDEVASSVANFQSNVASNSNLRPERKLEIAVELTCILVVGFLGIHPFADGNGHTARFMVVLLLREFGYTVNTSKWTIEPRPGHSGYWPGITKFRRGTRSPLKNFILNCVEPI